MSKIRVLEQTELVVQNKGTIHVAEALDGSFDISIFEADNNNFRIGIPSDGGTTFIYWKDIIRGMTAVDVEPKRDY